MSFEFGTLDTSKNEIRLLRPGQLPTTTTAVVPSHPTVVVPDLTLEFELETVSLDDEPEYVALSYVWGTDLTDHEITVDGKPFLVTKICIVP
jgi:hypothetical protein